MTINERSCLQNIVSGVPQGSLVGPTLSLNDLLFILAASIHNSADDNSLSNIVDNLKQKLRSR